MEKNKLVSIKLNQHIQGLDDEAEKLKGFLGHVRLANSAGNPREREANLLRD